MFLHSFFFPFFSFPLLLCKVRAGVDSLTIIFLAFFLGGACMWFEGNGIVPIVCS